MHSDNVALMVCSALVRSCLARFRVKLARHWSGRHSAICPSQHPRLQTTTNGNARSDFPGHLGERSIGRPRSSRPAGFHRQYTHFGRLRRGNPASVAAQRCRLSTLAAAAPYMGISTTYWESRGLLSTMGTQQSVEKLVINGGPHTLQVVVRCWRDYGAKDKHRFRSSLL